MRTIVDERLRDELRRFAVRYTCEDCVWFVDTDGTCALGYPNAEHRRRELETATDIIFCKEFDLAT